MHFRQGEITCHPITVLGYSVRVCACVLLIAADPEVEVREQLVYVHVKAAQRNESLYPTLDKVTATIEQHLERIGENY